MTQENQVATLCGHGLNVRATFINGPAEWFDVSGSARRAHSSPPASGACEEPQGAVGTPRRGRPALPVPKAGQGAKARDGSPSAASEASTAYPSPSRQSEVADTCTSRARPVLNLPNEGDLWWLSADSARECKDKALELVDAVERGCGFMRLNGHGLHAYSSDKARRQGMALNVRFYVRGLPSAKRAKWQQPLCWSAAAVLRSLGLDVRMQGGELQVPVRGGRPERGARQEPGEDDIFIRLEFVAGRL